LASLIYTGDMNANGFARLRYISVAVFTLMALGSASAISSVDPAVAANTAKVATITFAPGTTKLTISAKATLGSLFEQMRLAPSLSVVGYSSQTTKKKYVATYAMARAQAVRQYLLGLGLTINISATSGGLSPKSVKAKVADRATLAFSPTPGLLWTQDFNEPRGAAPSAKDFTGLNGDGCVELGLCNYGTGEIEFNDPSAVATDGQGNLVIHTTLQNGTWISERLWTAQKTAFLYGDLQIRAKMPVGSFNWPAIWMLGNNYQPPNKSFGSAQWPDSGELDIAEGLDGNSNVRGTLHGLDPIHKVAWNWGGGVSARAPLGDVSGDYHTWGVQSMPNVVIFSMDGVEYCRDTFDGNVVTQELADGSTNYLSSPNSWPFNQPMLLILDNAIPAGTNAPEGTSSEFKIDWIHYSTFMGLGQVVH